MKILILQKFGITFVKPINKGIDLYDYMSIGIHFIGFMSLKRMMFQPFKYRNISFVVMKMLEWKWENNVKDPIKLEKNSRLIFSFSTFGNGLCKGRNLQSLYIHCEVVYGYRPCTQNVF